MSFMFSHCESLKSLPDISNWNLSNVTNISYMFNNCVSLISLPDLSQWNTSKVTEIRNIFFGCESFINRYIKMENWKCY